MTWTRLPRTMSPILARTLAAAAAVAMLAACSSAGEEPARLDDTPTTAPTDEPSGEPAAGADAEAAVLDVYQRYWDARIQSVNGPDTSPEPFAGFATESTIALHLQTAQTYEQEGIVFTGEPRVYDTTVSIDGERGTVTSCVDDSEWVGTQNGEPLPVNPDKPTVYPVEFQVLFLNGSWLIGDPIDVEGEVSC
ncbi:hypothetical protein E1262_28215 [Jiangella aurantiaca]|uniref:Lipoprotein n=1 Tax=Jiangella aurantiaca TaxID=2530373 RepID=A0A4R4ZZF3_9ACTN|nr:hypothetical protein [Jiangella aurantiaca]TDD64455.1 hypothetical protein E1262_28215 [Jiangella aurantiaca]